MTLGSKARTLAVGRQGLGMLGHYLRKLRRLGNRVDQAPVHRFLAAHTFHAGTKNIGQIVAHMAFVGDAGQATRARQHTQQRHFGQRHAGGAVIDQHNLIAGQRQLVAAAGTCAVHSRDKFQTTVATAVFYAVAGFIGEFTKIHFPSVAGQTQHENIGA